MDYFSRAVCFFSAGHLLFSPNYPAKGSASSRIIHYFFKNFPMLSRLLFSLFFICSLFVRVTAQQPKLVLPVSSTNKLEAMKLSPDGRYAISADLDGVVKCWDAASGKLVQTFQHDGATDVAITPDNRYLVSGGLDQLLRVWDLESGVLYKTFSEHKTALTLVNIRTDGKWMATADQSGTVCLWDLTQWTLINSYVTDAGFPGALEFAGMQPWLALAATKNIYILSMDKKTFRLIGGHTDKVHSLEISPDGRQLLSGSWDNTAALRDVETGTLLATYTGHTNSVFDAQFSPDGKTVATAANDNTIRIWDRQTGRALSVFNGHDDWVTKIRFTTDGKKLISTSFDNTAGIWTYPEGKLLYRLEGHTDDLYFLSLNEKTGRIVVGSYDNDISSWDMRTGKMDFRFGIHNEKITSVAQSNSGRYTAITYRDGRIKVIDLLTGKLTLNINGHSDWALAAVFNLSDSILFTMGADNRLKAWSLPQGKLLADSKGDAGSVDAYLMLSRDGKQLVSFGGKTLSVFDLEKGTRSTRASSSGFFSKPVLSPSGKYIAEVNESAITVYSTADGKPVNRFAVTGRNPSAFFFSSDDRELICADKTVKVFLLQPGDTSLRREAFTGGGQDIYRAAWLDEAAGKLMVTDTLMRVFVLDRHSWKKEALFTPASLLPEVDKYRFARLTISPDRQYLLSDHGRYFRLWRIADGRHLGRFDGDDACFIPGTDRLLISVNGALNIYDEKTGGLVYTHFIAGEQDYIVMDGEGRFDGTELARRYLYFTCGKEIVELESLKDQLWVPGLVSRMMQGEQIQTRKLSELDICGQSPLVENKSDATHYIFSVKPRKGGLGETVMLINGIEYKRFSPAGLKRNQDAYELRLPRAAVADLLLSGQSNQVLVKAFSSSNSISSRGLILNEEKAKAATAAPRLYALMVGVSDYKGEELDLKYAAKDAADISAALGIAARKLLNRDGKEHVFMYNLTTGSDRMAMPEKAAIRKTLEDIGKKAGANDIVLIFFAGHGVMEGEKKQFYFLTSAASKLSAAESMEEVGISTAELAEWMRPQVLKAQKRILVFDACNSGQAIRDFVQLGQADQGYLAARNDETARQIKAIDKLNEKSGLFILSASASNQSAYELGRYSQGLLTYSLLKAIKQQPDILEDGNLLSVGRWFDAAEKTVTELSRENGARQEPQIVTNTNFTIGLVDEEVMAKIVLPQEKPLFAASNFQNSDEAIADDDLEFSKLVNLQLNELAMRGSTSAIVYVTATNAPDAWSMSGRYKTNGNNITVTINLKQNKQILQKFEVTGTRDKLKELAVRVAERAAELVVSSR